MKVNNPPGVTPRDARKLALEDLRRSMLIGSSLPRGPMVQRSMMSDEEQLASPEREATEDEFLPYPGAYGQVDVTPMIGALTPAQRALKAGYKGAVKKQEELATGGFDKIKRMLGLEKVVRDPEQARELVKARIENKLSHELPISSEQIQPMMRQKALQDTREALKQRAKRVADSAALPDGGYYFGLEPLQDTVVKGASLRQGFGLFGHGEIPNAQTIYDNPVTKNKAQVGTKFGVSHPYDRREVLENIEFDARKRVAADDILSKKGLAPESLVVRLPEHTYMVQDKAIESLNDMKKKAWLERELKVRSLERRKFEGSIPEDEADRLISEASSNYFAFVRQLDARQEAMKQAIRDAGLSSSDLHYGNIMTDKSGRDVVVDTQDFYRRTPRPNEYGADEVPLEPLPKDHWRVIRKPR